MDLSLRQAADEWLGRSRHGSQAASLFSVGSVTNECQGIETKYTVVHIPPRLFRVCVTSTRSVATCDYVTHSIHKQQYDTRKATDIKRMKHKSG